MRLWFRTILTVTSLAVCAAGAGLWIWGGSDTKFLYAKFASGHYDGDRSWRGSYLGVSRGQLVFEHERIGFAKKPATAPAGRWAAEDAVGIRTPALRGFPFDGPLGFHVVIDVAGSDLGELRIIQLGIPLWAIIAVSSIPLLVLAIIRLRRRRPPRPPAAA